MKAHKNSKDNENRNNDTENIQQRKKRIISRDISQPKSSSTSTLVYFSLLDFAIFSFWYFDSKLTNFWWSCF